MLRKMFDRLDDWAWREGDSAETFAVSMLLAMVAAWAVTRW